MQPNPNLEGGTNSPKTKQAIKVQEDNKTNPKEVEAEIQKLPAKEVYKTTKAKDLDEATTKAKDP